LLRTEIQLNSTAGRGNISRAPESGYVMCKQVDQRSIAQDFGAARRFCAAISTFLNDTGCGLSNRTAWAEPGTAVNGATTNTYGDGVIDRKQVINAVNDNFGWPVCAA